MFSKQESALLAETNDQFRVGCFHEMHVFIVRRISVGGSHGRSLGKSVTLSPIHTEFCAIKDANCRAVGSAPSSFVTMVACPAGVGSTCGNNGTERCTSGRAWN